jgi:hypothetical protein
VATSFEELHRGHVVGSLTMFDRLIFKGYLEAVVRSFGAHSSGLTRVLRRGVRCAIARASQRLNW